MKKRRALDAGDVRQRADHFISRGTSWDEPLREKG